MRRPVHSLSRRGGRLTLTVAAAAAGALALTACTGGGPGRDGGTDEPTATVTTTVTAPHTPTETATGSSGGTRTVTATTTPPTTAGGSPSSTTASPTVTTEPSPVSRPLGNPDLSVKRSAAPAPYGLMVSGVRVGSHGNFDRVVFDFAGQGTPGWYIDYTVNPTQQGSGAPIGYEGEIALQVGIEGTPYPSELGLEFPDHGTVRGSGNVTEVIYTSLFEGRTEFIIGVADRLPYSVTVLEEPTRLVIDIVGR